MTNYEQLYTYARSCKVLHYNNVNVAAFIISTLSVLVSNAFFFLPKAGIWENLSFPWHILGFVVFERSTLRNQEHIRLRWQTLTYFECSENVRTYTHNAKQNQSIYKGVSLGAFLNLFRSILFFFFLLLLLNVRTHLFHTPHKTEVSYESWNSPFTSDWCIILHNLRRLMNHMYITPVHKCEDQTLYAN